MKKKEDKENIFELSGKSGQRPLTGPEERAVGRFKSLFPKLERRPPPEGSPPPSAEEQQQAFERAKTMHKEIKQKIDNLFSSNRITPKQLREFLSTSSNFRKGIWRALQEEKKIVEQKLVELAPPKKTAAEPKQEPPAPPASEPTQGQAPPKPKTKGLLKKSRWMPMR